MTGSTPSPQEQLAALGQAVITTDVDGVVVAWNPAAELLYGWTASEAIGHPISELCVPDLAQEVAEEIMEALRSGVAWSGGFPVRRKDGSSFHALVTDSGVYRDGELVGIVGISTNLGTAVRPLLARSVDAALVLRPDATITYASPAVRQLFGWADDELVGASLIPLLHPDDQVALIVFLEAVLGGAGTRPAREVRVRRGEGWTWAEAVFTNFLDDPLVRGVVCNLRRSLVHARDDEEDVVERARGYLCGRDGVDADTALARLRSLARDRALRLEDAADLVLAGQVPRSA